MLLYPLALCRLFTGLMVAMLVYTVSQLLKCSSRVILTRALGIFLTCLAETPYLLKGRSNRKVE